MGLTMDNDAPRSENPSTDHATTSRAPNAALLRESLGVVFSALAPVLSDPGLREALAGALASLLSGGEERQATGSVLVFGSPDPELSDDDLQPPEFVQDDVPWLWGGDWHGAIVVASPQTAKVLGCESFDTSLPMPVDMDALSELFDEAVDFARQSWDRHRNVEGTLFWAHPTDDDLRKSVALYVRQA